MFHNKRDQDGIVVRNKAKLVAKVTLKLKVLTLEKHMLWLQDWKQLGSY
jgi:hypothetical protein